MLGDAILVRVPLGLGLLSAHTIVFASTTGRHRSAFVWPFPGFGIMTIVSCLHYRQFFVGACSFWPIDVFSSAWADPIGESFEGRTLGPLGVHVGRNI